MFPSCHGPRISNKADLLDRFGAVLEEFEVRDALSNLFAAKEALPSEQVDMPHQTAIY